MNKYKQMLSGSDDEDIPLAKRKWSVKNKQFSVDERLSCVTGASSEANLPDSKPKWDKYCWGCHKECAHEVHCSNCVISFHKNCTPDMHRCKPGWKCVECQSNQKCLDNDDLSKCYIYIVERLLRKTIKNGTFNVPYDYTNSLLINPVSFADIVEKSKRNEYANTHALLLDFKWLCHNCEILHSKRVKQEKKNLVGTRNIARNLLKSAEKEIDLYRKCPECYVNNNVDIYLVCSKPHLVVWAQFDIYPYWPAKILNIYDASRTLEVFFFNDHTSAIVSYDNCFLYCNHDPNDYMTGQYKDDIRKAKEEASKYIENIERKFGPLQLPTTFIKPIPGKLDTMHLDEIIPGFRNPEKRVRPNVSEALFQSFENSGKDHDINDDVSHIDNLNLADKSKCHHKTEAKASKMNVGACIPINKPFLERVRACQQALRELRSESEMQRAEIIELRKENERLKSELAHAK
ncbi:MYND-type zinc finger-containing chromatin reader Zmynd8-like [Sitodiplosis mosellana]|uniref:MYND-type zinc finger-containing chromatin reader Zmynd8-like n=1 Tax=Sitodiplosis mosellana TaxID=263140 RepID=UPI002444E13E|nr:MYND-type zinc finger-containing chromatin reader Zmynd8-like [Sitodiplosis mosellana]